MYKHQGAHLSTVGVQAFYVSCMQLITKNPNALGLRRFLENILLVLDPNVLNTPLALFHWPGLIHVEYMNEPQHTHTWGPPTCPINSTRSSSWPAWHRCRCPITKHWAQRSGPVHKPPRLELKLVSVKRLTAHLQRPTCLMSNATHKVFWGNVSPYSITSVHVAITNGCETLSSALHLYVNPSKIHTLFTVSFPFPLLFWKIMLSLPQTNLLASRWVFLSCDCF